jgi:hypothetical protein
MTTPGNTPRSFESPRGSLTRVWLLLAILTLLLTAPAIQPSSANAGTYDVYACSQPDRASAPVEDWTPFSNNIDAQTEDNCAQGLFLTAGMLGWVEVPVGAEAGWTFLPPAGTSIKTAILRWDYNNDDNEDSESATSYESLLAPAHYSHPFDTCVHAKGCCCSVDVFDTSPSNLVTVPAQDLQAEPHGPTPGITMVAGCSSEEGGAGHCNGGAHFTAWSAIHAITTTLEDGSPPQATVLGGSLTTGTELEGSQTLAISGTDSGSGIYQAILEVDGRQAQSTTVDSNNGHCQNVGQTADGSPAFLYAVPCKLEINDQYVSFNLAGIPNGPHKLSVRVTDAAGNSTTVLDREVIVGRGACNGTCDDQAKLGLDDPKLLKPITRRYPSSEMTLSGSLLEPNGAYVAGAHLELIEQPSYTGAPEHVIAGATTNAAGQWTFAVPKGPSRVLTVAWRSHALDAGYATELEFHESVIADIALQAPRRVRVGSSFDCQGYLAGGYVPRERSTIQMEIYFLRRWRTIETLRTNSRGRFAYRYSFSTGAGRSYRFRASIRYTATYPFMASTSRPVRVRVR